MPFALALPSGTYLALLGTFALLGMLAVRAVLTEKRPVLTVAAIVHALAGVLAVLAADLITLLISWELLTFSAYIVIRTRSRLLPDTGGRASERAATWYIAAQICAAAVFFVAIVIHAQRSGSIAVEQLHRQAQPFLLAAVLVKTAMIPLHGWLVDGYTRASPAGAILLSVYATKVGVYTAARLLSFEPGLVPVTSLIGAVVAVVAVSQALLQRSARRLLSYHIVSQVGYMLAGVGAIAGAGVIAGTFHAVNHIIYKALLFMVVTAVMHRLGHDDLKRMGGLRSSMPLTFVCGAIGAAAISGLPLTSGYASKELLKGATSPIVGYLLAAASAGTGLSFLKFIYLIFLRPVQAVAAQPAAVQPRVRAGMVILAFLSVLIGVAPTVVPGVPAYAYYGRSALVAGIWPLIVSVLLWLLFRSRLVAGLSHRVSRAPIRTGALTLSRPLLLLLRRVHALNPQFSVGIAVTGILLLGVLMILLS